MSQPQQRRGNSASKACAVPGLHGIFGIVHNGRLFLHPLGRSSWRSAWSNRRDRPADRGIVTAMTEWLLDSPEPWGCATGRYAICSNRPEEDREVAAGACRASDPSAVADVDPPGHGSGRDGQIGRQNAASHAFIHWPTSAWPRPIPAGDYRDHGRVSVPLGGRNAAEHSSRSRQPSAGRARTPGAEALCDAPTLLFVMPVSVTVNIAVVQFLGGRRAQVDHLDLKVQRLAGQRVVEVQHDGVAAYLGDERLVHFA